MDTVDSVLRPVRRERQGRCEERHDPLEIFREFIDHLGRAAQGRREKPAKAKGPRAGKR
jgi:hypothetical protein